MKGLSFTVICIDPLTKLAGFALFPLLDETPFEDFIPMSLL